MPKMGNKPAAARPAAAATEKRPRIVAIDADGKATRLKAERLEIDFGDGRKLLLAFPERAWGDLEIEADADDEAAVPMLSRIANFDDFCTSKTHQNVAVICKLQIVRDQNNLLFDLL